MSLSSRTFVDTSAIFAALVANDPNHEPAKVEMQRLLEGSSTLCVTSYVIVETMALLQSRVGLTAALEFESAYRPIFEVVWVNGGLHSEAVGTLREEQSRNLSLVDCCSFVVMRKQSIDLAFAFDDDFTRQGFNVIPG